MYKMRKCITCGKEMKLLEGHNLWGEDYCSECFDKRNSNKNKNIRNTNLFGISSFLLIKMLILFIKIIYK